MEQKNWFRTMNRKLTQKGIVIGELADFFVGRYRLCNMALNAGKVTRILYDIHGNERVRETMPDGMLKIIKG